jgi:hypothetical protein
VVAGCLAERNGPGDLAAARALLAPLAGPGTSRCLPAADQGAIAAALRSLQERDQGPPGPAPAEQDPQAHPAPARRAER